MNYKFELTADEVVLLGKAVGLLTISEGVALHNKLQQSIFKQEADARALALKAQQAALEKQITDRVASEAAKAAEAAKVNGASEPAAVTDAGG